jgi:hypothetical protein
MFEAYRIRPVLEWEGSDESRELEVFNTLGEATARQAKLMRDDPHADVEPRIFWTLYGINPERDGVRSEDAIADRTAEADALDLLGKIIGRFTADPRAGSHGYFIADQSEAQPEDSEDEDDGPSIEVSLTLSINLNLLRRQKNTLFQLVPGSLVTPRQDEVVEGILNLIDFIQDAIFDQGLASEEEIFKLPVPADQPIDDEGGRSGVSVPSPEASLPS